MPDDSLSIGMEDPSAPDSELLTGEDPAPFEVINPDSLRPLLLICDHASRVVPAQLGRLGVAESIFDLHVAYDIGAAAVTRGIAARLGLTAVLNGYSRLVIDCNRQPGDPQSIPETSDDIPIPGNAALSEHDQLRRETAIFRPYHGAISERVTHLWRSTGKPPALFSIHSFTPHMNGEARPWDAGLLWNRDPRIAVPLMESLRIEQDLMIGDNEPYSGRDVAYSIDVHAGAAGLANAAIEIRQDLLLDEAGIVRWIDLLSEALSSLLQNPNLHEVEYF
ncbi:MAG: N-formylglutamate amidohydrolase [Magnetospiraceae bacterium]